MKRLLMLLMIFLFSLPAAAEEAALMFEQANQAYRANEYAKAAAAYEQILKNGVESPALYYNLGNACFKLENIPMAILYFERAHRLAPRDEDISYNLRLANLRIVDRIEPVPELFFVAWWKSLINAYSSGGWAIIAITALWIVAIGTAVLLMSRRFILQRIAFAAALLALAVTVVGFTATYQRLQNELNVRSAILTAPSVSVKSAPDDQSTDLFVLHEGVKLEYLDSVGDWRKIRLADGKVGWVHSNTAIII
jgi:tetratricopeptide (TPR) repeat protein